MLNLSTFDPIEFKAGATLAELAESGLLPFWRRKHKEFLDKLRSVSIGAVILDFDGTVYAGGQRHNAIPDDEMTAVLTALLETGICLGFASGRGLSLREALRKTFAQKFWPFIYAAYQDGAELGRLDDDSLPSAYDPALEHPLLAQARGKLARIFEAWPNPPALRPENQLLGLYADPQSSGRIFEACCEVALPLALKVFNTGKIVDITLPNVSKRNLEPHLVRSGGEVLAIGDAGAWPGNDYELLASPLGLSVGSVTADPDCCWRLTKESGIEATRGILLGLLDSRQQGAEKKTVRFKCP